MKNQAKNQMKNHRPLKLKAINGKDISTLSMYLQDSICSVTAMTFKENMFFILANRFCHETSDEEEFFRINSGVFFFNVLEVKKKNFHQKDERRLLNLLAITYRDDNSENKEDKHLLNENQINKNQSDEENNLNADPENSINEESNLNIDCESSEDKNDCNKKIINLIFSEDIEIQIIASDVLIYLEDYNEPWITDKKPIHKI